VGKDIAKVKVDRELIPIFEFQEFQGNKKNFLEAYNRTMNISEACRDANITRRTYYLWRAKDDAFRDKVEELKEALLDWAESQLHNEIKRRNTPALFFFLKCMGKHRGWQEYAKIDHTVKHEIPEIKIVLSGEKRDELQDKE